MVYTVLRIYTKPCHSQGLTLISATKPYKLTKVMTRPQGHEAIQFQALRISLYITIEPFFFSLRMPFQSFRVLNQNVPEAKGLLKCQLVI